MGEKKQKAIMVSWMGPPKCSEAMHALVEHTFLHVQMPMCDIIMGVVIIQ